MSDGNIKEALQYAVHLHKQQNIMHEVNGINYYDADKASLRQLEPIKYAETLQVNTLTGLVDYLKEKFDLPAPHNFEPKLLIQVDSPTKVVVYSSLNAERRRESIIEANALLERFPYGRFQDSEQFIINMQSLVQRDLDAQAILECAGSIRIEGGADLEDNGVSQIVSARMGAATVGKAEVPSPAELRPYRTFLEVEQPSSTFVFRINKEGACALFEADGGVWKNFAMQNVKEFLLEQLKEEIESGYLTVIA